MAQLALSGNMPVAGTAIPFGATGLDSPGLSPAPTGTMTYRQRHDLFGYGEFIVGPVWE